MPGEASGQSAGGQGGEQQTQGAGEQRAGGGRSGEQDRQQQQRGQASMQRRGEPGGMLGWPTPFGLMRRLFDDMERLAGEYVPGRFGPEGSGRGLERIAREGADVQNAEARFDDGVLELTIPLPQEARARRIDIQEGKPGQSVH